MRRVIDWLLRCLRWSLRPWPVWLGVGVVVVVCLFAWVCPWHDAESRMRCGGTALQLAGLSLTAIGIIQTRAVFNLLSPVSIVRNWFAARPKLRTNTVLEVPTGRLSMRAGDVHLRTGPGADRPIDEKVAWLIEQLDQLDRRMALRLREVADNAAAQVAQEQNARSAENAELRRRLMLSATGGLNLSAVGLIWLVLGTVLAGFAPELAAALIQH